VGSLPFESRYLLILRFDATEVILPLKYIPSLVLCVYTLSYVAGFIEGTFFTCLYGLMTTWIYIRFFQVLDGIKGYVNKYDVCPAKGHNSYRDRSETMSFVTFFPDRIQ
jgi:hypothetical protein